jgi:hypothetical protein
MLDTVLKCQDKIILNKRHDILTTYLNPLTACLKSVHNTVLNKAFLFANERIVEKPGKTTSI